MHFDAHMILIVKYIVAAILFVGIMMAPAYLAAQNKKDKTDTVRIRAASWLLGWTGVGWLIALFWAIKK